MRVPLGEPAEEPTLDELEASNATALVEAWWRRYAPPGYKRLLEAEDETTRA
jgi:hypothetical protein